MFNWLTEKSRKRSAANIATLVAQLIALSNEAHAQIGRTGTANPAHIDAVKKLQNDLYFELCGPLEITEVRSQIIEPALAGAEVSEGAKMAVWHVYNTFVARQAKKD